MSNQNNYHMEDHNFGWHIEKGQLIKVKDQVYLKVLLNQQGFNSTFSFRSPSFIVCAMALGTPIFSQVPPLNYVLMKGTSAI